MGAEKVRDGASESFGVENRSFGAFGAWSDRVRDCGCGVCVRSDTAVRG